MHATKLVYVFKYRGLLVEPLSINGSIKLLIIYPRTFVNFKTNCTRALCANLYRSFPDRCDAVMDNLGYRTKY